jgi:hypothetical protein
MSKKHRRKRARPDRNSDSAEANVRHAVCSRQIIDDFGVVVGSITVTVWRTPDEQ